MTDQAQGSWHPDPNDPSILRWWDGTRWTEHTSPNPEAQGRAADSQTTPKRETSQPEPSPLPPGVVWQGSRTTVAGPALSPITYQITEDALSWDSGRFSTKSE